MKGINKLVLNPETMNAAVQHWIDQLFHSWAPQVQNIEFYPDNNTFEVTLKEQPSEEVSVHDSF